MSKSLCLRAHVLNMAEPSRPKTPELKEHVGRRNPEREPTAEDAVVQERVCTACDAAATTASGVYIPGHYQPWTTDLDTSPKNARTVSYSAKERATGFQTIPSDQDLSLPACGCAPWGAISEQLELLHQKWGTQLH